MVAPCQRLGGMEASGASGEATHCQPLGLGDWLPRYPLQRNPSAPRPRRQYPRNPCETAPFEADTAPKPANGVGGPTFRQTAGRLPPGVASAQFFWGG